MARSQRNLDAPSPRELDVLAAVADGLDNATRTGAVAEARRRGHLR